MGKKQAKAKAGGGGGRVLSGPQRVEMKAKKVRKENPFERRFGTEKHRVLNRKSGGHALAKTGAGAHAKPGAVATGRPGMARYRAQQKRKATLLPEYERRHKSGSFVDRRLGEGNAGMSAEDRAEARFAAAERARSRKRSLFHLGGDDEEESMLTHSGRAISEIERFDDPRSDEEGEDEEDKKLNAKFVGETHFGGFMNQADFEFSAGKDNRKEWIDKMIADSKARKLEKQRNTEESESLTKDLDGQWRDMFGKLKMSGQVYTKGEKAAEDEEEKDSYDTLLRELTFAKGKQQAKDRLKTEEEVVRDEKDKLEKLEQERVKRMRGEGDDLDEREEQEEDDEEEQEGEEEEEVDLEEEEGSDEEDDDKGSDLEDSESETEAQPDAKVKTKKSEKKISSKAALDTHLPFTFTVPETHEALESLLSDRSPSDRAVIVERVIKCNHPQLGEGNKERLQSFFTFLLQHIHDCAVDFGAADEGECLESLDTIQRLTPFLYDLAHFWQQPAAKAVLSVIQEKYDAYCKQPRVYPGTETLVFLKLSCLLFPTSDYRHPVVTPAVNFMSHALSSGRVNSRSAVASGLFISALLTESLRLSKRFSPELSNFLTGIVFVSLRRRKGGRALVEFVPPFKAVGPEAELLAKRIREGCAPETLSFGETKSVLDVDGPFASSSLSTALRLLSNLVDLWGALPSASEVFCHLSRFLPMLLEEDSMHPQLRKEAETLRDKLASLSSAGKRPIAKERSKPKILRQYEPEFDDSFDPLVKKRETSKGAKAEMSKLAHKLKRERKGARKEIRQDAAFLAKTKAQEDRERDQERMRKTREILSGLGNQEGDYRKMQRKKKRTN